MSARRKTHQEFVKDVYSAHGDEYKVVGFYVNSRTEIVILHSNCNKEFKPTPANFLSGSKCPYCAVKSLKTHEKFLEELREIHGAEYVVLEEYKGINKKIKFKHLVCNHEWSTTPRIILNGKCPECNRKHKMKHRIKTTSHFKKDVMKLVGNEYSVSSDYLHCRESISITHNVCKKTYSTTPTNFLRGIGRCPECSPSSTGEKMITKILTLWCVDFLCQYTIKNCRNKRKLPFDFAIFDNEKKLAMLIEFDGEQHYRPSFGDESFQITQRNDQIKNRYCSENNIPLLRIPYWLVDDIKDILVDSFNKLSLVLHNKEGESVEAETVVNF